jgi:hypothetical protein
MRGPRFWSLSPPRSTALLAEWDDAVELESIVCSQIPGHQRAGRRVTPLTVVIKRPVITDFVWTWFSECLVTTKVLDVFRQAGLSGFETREAQARYKRPSMGSPPDLRELVVTGWAGIAPASSGIVLREACPSCGHRSYSCFTQGAALVDPKQWDGHDLFMVWPLPRFVLLSDYAVQTLRDARLTGARLESLASLECRDGFSPGRLSYYMPEERARLLGAHLGIF